MKGEYDGVARKGSMIKLNPEQLQAVEHGAGPQLVIAGPGSGKTRVITQRVVHLLEHVPRLQPQNILALTFTDKAAAEMQHRVRQALPGLENSAQISTFHAFCYFLLRQVHFERPLLDEIDVWIFLRRRMAALELDYYQKLAEPGAFLHDLNNFFSRCQDELIEPADFAAYVRQVDEEFLTRAAGLSTSLLQREEVAKLKELARVFRHSRRLIEEAGSSSLGSLISEAVRLLDRDQEMLERCRNRYQYVLVDEFQDTNFAQVELLRRLVGPPFNITAVGDDDQAIYRFRGASHGAFQMFDDVFPGHSTVYLDRNYRSTRRILRAATTVIAKNDRYENKKPLRTENDEGPGVYLLACPDYESEAGWVADEVERLTRRGRAYGEIAVLYRAHHHRDLLVREFRRREIPFAIRGLSLLATPLLRDLVAYLRLIHSPHDNVSLTRVLLAPHWRFPEDLALAVRKQAVKDRCSIWSALEAMERTLFSSELKSTGWPELAGMVHEMRKRAESACVTALFDRLVGRLALAFLPGDPDAARLDAFHKFLAAWEPKSETKKLGEFMEYFEYFLEAGGMIEAPEPEHPANAVQMMTVHAAKGLEFPVVFILSVARQRFPHREERPVIAFPDELRKGPPIPPDIHLQEERRLFYVGMTRARERLYVSSVGAPGKNPSVFVDDLLADPVVRARDVERILVPQLLGDPSARPALRPATRPASSPPADEGTGQVSLFNHIESDYVHPDLAAWANRAPEVSPDGKLQLSATAIESYRECPLRFKYTHYYKIPTGAQAALTFGSIMHQSVRHYFRLRREGAASYDAVREFYLRAWKDVGFEDSYQEETYKQAGLDQLRAFVERHNASALPAGELGSEERFTLDLGDVLLDGRIDQINPLAGNAVVGRADISLARALATTANAGTSRTPALPAVELIDYKTGRPRSQKDADKSLQLSIYALAARRELHLSPVRLTFYNLTNNQPVSTVRTAKDLDKPLAEIREVAARIRSLVFDPRPGFGCKYCEFVPICPAHEEDF
ncbi:MAG TPA: ATP-dependent DNA helicase [Terriglobia bacterium]|nr:ATP-dependent DNA helicase [Terriglobia bacterium]